MANITLNHEGKTFELPVTVGTEKEGGIDISKLRGSTGLVTLDPGFVNTASTTSAITFLDGEQGILRYRGYPIEQLASQSNFLETAYLLIYGELPSAAEFERFQSTITRHTLLQEDFRKFFDAFPRDAHPMAIVASTVSALSTFYQDSLDPNDPQHVEVSTVRLLAKLPTIAAWAYKRSRREPYIYPDNSLGYAGNFLQMMFGYPTEKYDVDPEYVKALDLLLILHADHEQNCSTSTVRIVGSSKANMFASVSRASARSGARCTAAPTRRCSRCSRASTTTAATCRSTSTWPRTRTATSASWASATASTRTSTPARRSSRWPATACSEKLGIQRPAARPRQAARGDRPQGRLLRVAQALPQRGLLLGHHLPRARHPHQHVHGDVRARPPARLDRPLA
jgi:hypothetical protein